MTTSTSHPRRQLDAWDGIALYVGVILGSGIFFAPSAVAGAFPDTAGAITLWLVGGVVTVCGALCYAECGARLPEDGGFFVFYRVAFGEGFAWLGGWVAVLITYPASIAAILLYLGQSAPAVLPSWPLGAAPTAALAIVISAVLNTVGVRAGTMAQRIFTALKVCAVVVLAAAAFLVPPAVSPGGPTEVIPSVSVLAAVVAVLWTYSGWSDITLVAGELRNPARDLSRTVIVGTTLLVVVYAGVQWVVTHALGAAAVAREPAVFAAAVERGLGDRAGSAIALVVVVSTFGAAHGTILGAARLTWAMAQGRMLPTTLGRTSPRFGTPARATWALATVSLGYVALADFGRLLEIFSFAVWFFYAATAVALLRLRRRGIGEPVAYRAPLGPTAPLVIIAAAVILLGTLAANAASRRDAGLGIALSLLAVPPYLVWRGFQRRRHERPPS